MALALTLLIRGHHRSATGVFSTALAFLYLCSTGLVSGLLLGWLEDAYPPTAMSATGPADAIVLLGGGTRGYAHMASYADLNEHADRLLHTAALYKAGKAPLIIVTGGGPEGDVPEATQMRDILELMGVPGSAILEEKNSRNTYENALYSAQLLKEKRLERVLLVTSAYHMRRAQAVFVAQGVPVVPAPTDYKRTISRASTALVPYLPTLANLSGTTLAIHELIGYWTYRVQGRI